MKLRSSELWKRILCLQYPLLLLCQGKPLYVPCFRYLNNNHTKLTQELQESWVKTNYMYWQHTWLSCNNYYLEMVRNLELLGGNYQWFHSALEPTCDSTNLIGKMYPL